VLGAGEPEIFPQHLEERLVDRHERLTGLAIDGQGDADFHPGSICSA